MRSRPTSARPATNGHPDARIDAENPHSARIYDYILGGADHYRSRRPSRTGPDSAARPERS
jgi:hypothetical protein